ncbi:DNA-3-methyladenine glycosidase I [Spiroplasma gladiatoris]|uniref:DNA-3-methyladenine glycosidase I n=1 Tax=Spiroplasma gladiatoris TaxID=2143 RepID=A0A4V1AQD0_9MOLU|nr:DNA-3-methyladenine glycosylase I [Spiroplasma gladiatoris]QBQ08069.1 DNA-3-methyladenine glycosidase I [Spiroplasma gladiatoris]
MKRCDWANLNKTLQNYHDNEWSICEFSDYKLFEVLCLEIMQAGLSWDIILKKRKFLKQAFNNFDFSLVKNYDSNKIDNLLINEKIIRNKSKILSIINNAKILYNWKSIYNYSFSEYIWSFTNNKPIINFPKTHKDVQSLNFLSIQISKELKTKGFKFIGPTIIYSFLQAIGVIDDHLIDCYKKNKQ